MGNHQLSIYIITWLTTINVGPVASQYVFDCPSDWISFETQCYKFVSFPEERLETARAACGIHGAALLSINSRTENTFITESLQRLDPYRRSWYTSGIEVANEQTGESDVGSEPRPRLFKWEGDGTDIRFDLQFWLPVETISDETDLAIVYKYGVTGYGWSLGHPGDMLPYVCEISQAEAYRIVINYRDYDYGIDNPDPNDLLRGPSFTLHARSMVVVGSSESAEVECIASGNPNPQYKWYRGEDMITQVTSQLDSRYTLTNGRLTIQNPVEELDEGDYRCVTENVFGKLLGNPITLSFGSLGEFSNVPDAGVRATAYDGVAIECSRIAFRPAVMYQWLKGDTRTFVRPELQPYMFISANGKLYFSEVTRTDEGEYRCIAILTGVNRYTIGTAQPPTRTSLPIRLIVQDQAAKADWGPEIQNDFIAVFPQPPQRGQNVRLECFAYGSSTTPFVYSWSRSDRPMPSSTKMMDHNRVLVIEDAQLEDSGNYTCTVSRGSSARDSKTISLQLQARPYFIIPLQNQHVDMSSQLTWRCVARGNPPPTYTWYKNGEMLESVPGDIQVSGSTLTVFKLDPDRHNGMYQCAARNTNGVTLNGAQLRVLSFKPTFSKSPLPRTTEAALNGNVTLTCSPEGAPQPDIVWSKNGATLPVDSGHFRQLINGFLIITGIQQSDQGEYRCTATNINGEATTSTRLKVATTTRITTAPSNTKVIINQTAFFYCQASHDPVLDMVYVWRFNNRRIDFSDDTHYVQDLNPLKTGLYIKGVHFKHAGTYKCTARTPLGEDSREATLTVSGPPGEPAGVYIPPQSVTSHGAEVRWTPGVARGASVTLYTIESQSVYETEWTVIIDDLPAADTLPEEGHMLRAVVGGLNPGVGYRFRVRAITQYGLGDPSVPSAVIQTPSAPPSVSPSNVRGGGGSVGDLTIRWKLLELWEHGGTGLGYMVYWRRQESNTVETSLWRKQRVGGDVDHYVELVGVENYYLEYEVKVGAFNDYGYGPNSTIETIYSAEGLPVGTPTEIFVDGFNGTALEVTWAPVPDIRTFMKGKVMGYQINYWPAEDNDPPHLRFLRVEGQVDTAVIIGLAQDSEYYSDVQVYNSAGLGPRSTNFIQETSGDAPLTYPQEVRITSNGPDSVHVWWRGISITTNEETVEGYKIYYWPSSEDFRSAMIVETEIVFETIIEDLDEGVLYTLRIAAFSEGGDGVKTPKKYFTLGGSVRIDSTLSSMITIRAAATYSHSSVSLICFSLSFVFILKCVW